MAKPRCKFLELGQRPVELINATLGTELEPGNAILTVRAHEHVEADHPDE